MNRFILLGASNARRGFPTIVHAARRALSGPARILTAIGHGRSYGMRSSVLARGLPAILECGLWDALAEAEDAPTLAVVTDVGNDLLYGAGVSEILSWVSSCLDHLARVNARIVITGLPLERLCRLDRAGFLLFRTILFPASRLTLDEMKRRAAELDLGLSRLATRSKAAFVKPQPEWYRFDPIHIRFGRIPDAWASIFGVPPPTLSFADRLGLKLRFAAPQERSIFGVERYRRQPALKLANGSTVSLF